jgi:predicted RNA-binding protein
MLSVIAPLNKKTDITKMKEFNIMHAGVCMEAVLAMNIKDAKAYAKDIWGSKVKVVRYGA